MRLSCKLVCVTALWIAAGVAGGGVVRAAEPGMDAAPTAPAAPAVTRVYPGPAPCANTLQACISASSHGDTVSVQPGLYVTSTLIITRGIRLEGAGAADTILQASGGRVISISANITQGVVISGVRVQNGLIASGGAGIVTGAITPLSLMNAEVMSNSTTSPFVLGGGLFAGGPAYITDTRFVSNSTQGYGGGAWFNVTATLRGGEFVANSAGSAGSGDGGGARFNGFASVTGTLFALNSAQFDGGGAMFWHTGAVTNSQFISNTAGNDGGGAYFNLTATVRLSLFVTNTALGANFGYGGGARFENAATVGGSEFRQNWSLRDGGGAYFYGTPNSLTFVGNTKFISNAQSGASFNADTVLNKVQFIGNTAQCCAGASFGPVVMADTDFIDNVAASSHGGGAYFWNPAILSNVTFERNAIRGIFGSGGAAFFYSSTVMNRVTVIGNGIYGDGGLLFGHGGGMYFNDTAVVTASAFLSNVASSRGGAVQAERDFTMTNSLVRGNHALVGGGLAYDNPASTPHVGLAQNVLFAGNVATTGLGAQIWMDHPSARLDVVHGTLADPGLNPGSAIALDVQSTVQLTNSIIANHAIGTDRNSGSNLGGVREAFSLFSGVAQPFSGTAFSAGGSFTAPVQFVNPATSNYRIQISSPARNAGMAAGVGFDFEGDPRLCRPDIGFDETGLPCLVYLPATRRSGGADW